jgi:hypothetical protein
MEWVLELGRLANQATYHRGYFDQQKGKWQYPDTKEPLTDEVVQCHLRSAPPIAIRLRDGRHTRAAVIDLDDKDGSSADMAGLYVSKIAMALEARKIPFFVVRSGGGRGFHIWLVFSRPVVVDTVRKSILALLGDCHVHPIKEGKGGVSKREVEIYPDASGSGGQIALPLARESRLLKRAEVKGSDGSTLIPVYDEPDEDPTSFKLPFFDWPKGGARHTKPKQSVPEDVAAEAFAFASKAYSVDDYKQWIDCGLLLKAHDPSRFDLWNEWARGSASYPGEIEAQRKWTDDLTPTKFTTYSLFRVAREQGWQGSFAEGIVTTNRPTVAIVEEAWSAIEERNADTPELFRMGTAITRISDDGQNRAIIEALQKDGFAYELERCASWLREGRSGPVHCPVPDFVIRDMLKTRPGEMRVPMLSTISRVPVFCEDGTLHVEPGYDARSQAYYLPEVSVAVPDDVTLADVEAAVRLFRDDLLVDFPFEDEASFAHSLSWALMPFVRAFVRRPMPLHFINKSTHGSGGGLLTEVLSLPYLGHAPEVVQAQVSDDELRKKITAKFRNGSDFVNLDNVEWLDSAVLAMALTAEYWSDRLLGYSEEVKFPNNKIWVGSGNNVGMSGEIARRTLLISIDPDDPEPFLRGGFKHANLSGWARDNRARLVGALLVIVKWWIKQGMPLAEKRIGSFERFCEVMGGILECAGVSGFLANVGTGEGMSQAERARKRLIGLWLDYNLKNPEKAVWEATATFLAQPEWIDRAEFDWPCFSSPGQIAARLGKEMSKANKKVYRLTTVEGREHTVKFFHRANQRKPFVLQMIGEPSSPGIDCEIETF